MAVWWSPGQGFVEGIDPLPENFEFTPAGFLKAGYGPGLQRGEYGDPIYVRCWHGNEHLMVEIPWTQFYVMTRDQSLFFATMYRELVRDYLLSEQLSALQTVSANLGDVTDTLDVLSRQIMNDLADISSAIRASGTEASK